MVRANGSTCVDEQWVFTRMVAPGGQAMFVVHEVGKSLEEQLQNAVTNPVCGILGIDVRAIARVRLIAQAPALLRQLEAMCLQLEANGMIVPPNVQQVIAAAKGESR